jgi:hypothetical protein
VTRPLPLLAALLAALALAACETALDPIEASGRFYSLSGTLDASADTQWVRVEPVAGAVGSSAEPLDVRVTLAGSGGTVVLSQRVVAFESGPAHLFWTTADVEPGTTYDLAAERPDGATTRTAVRVPEAFPAPTLIDGEFQCPTQVYVQAERVVDVVAIYEPQGGGPSRFSKRMSLTTVDGGRQRAQIYYGDDARRMDRDPLPDASVQAEVLVAVGTDDWPAEATLETASIPGRPGLVENGVGFVGGVVTWRSPFVPGIGVAAPPGGGGQPDLPCVSRR